MIAPDAKIHSHAIVENGATIGARTRVWAFAHILGGARVGADCNICDHTFIENEVVIGDRVTIKSGIYIWDGATVGDDVHLGPCVVFTNDRYPRSKQVFELGRIDIGRGASIGANATLLPDVRVGQYAMVGAGSVVNRAVADFALVVGNPIRQIGWVCVCGKKLDLSNTTSAQCECGRKFTLSADNRLSVVV